MSPIHEALIDHPGQPDNGRRGRPAGLLDRVRTRDTSRTSDSRPPDPDGDAPRGGRDADALVRPHRRTFGSDT